MKDKVKIKELSQIEEIKSKIESKKIEITPLVTKMKDYREKFVVLEEVKK